MVAAATGVTVLTLRSRPRVPCYNHHLVAQIAGLSRVAFLFALGRFGLSPIGVDPAELADDLAHA